MEELRVDDVEAASQRISSHVRKTPVLRSQLLDGLVGAELHLKAEHEQRTGSFKARGAFNALLCMDAAQRARGVITVSSGNHGQALALAASELGSRALVVAPEGANPVKLAGIRRYGGEVETFGVTADNREERIGELARERGLPLVHPFDDLRVMAGQGTVGLELIEETGPLDAVVVPVGGGGLLSGVACAVKARSPRTRVIAIEPEAAADLKESLAAGRRIPLERAPETICDGVRSLCVGERPWEVIRRLVDEAVTVTDGEVLEAMEVLRDNARITVEPSGALATAAVLTGRVHGQRVGVILSGGNLNPALRLKGTREDG